VSVVGAGPKVASARSDFKDPVRENSQTSRSSRRLIQFSASGSTLEACRFGNARVENASSGNGRESSEYVECSFDGVSPPADYTKLGTDAVNAVVALLTDG
jgi:hypothetical protein